MTEEELYQKEAYLQLLYESLTEVTKSLESITAQSSDYTIARVVGYCLGILNFHIVTLGKTLGIDEEKDIVNKEHRP